MDWPGIVISERIKNSKLNRRKIIKKWSKGVFKFDIKSEGKVDFFVKKKKKLNDNQLYENIISKIIEKKNRLPTYVKKCLAGVAYGRG